jgi:hypothetical protein
LEIFDIRHYPDTKVFFGQPSAFLDEAARTNRKGLTPVKEDLWAEMDTPERYSMFPAD